MVLSGRRLVVSATAPSQPLPAHLSALASQVTLDSGWATLKEGQMTHPMTWAIISFPTTWGPKLSIPYQWDLATSVRIGIEQVRRGEGKIQTDDDLKG